MSAYPGLVMFCIFVAIALVVIWWASARNTTSKGFYAAHREVSGMQNGWAIAGDYMSAAAFLGVAGLIAFYGFDGFMYSVGFLVSYLAVLLLIAEPLRNAGKYTTADLISFRLHGNGVRAVAAVSTLVITIFYMVAQMVGAGSLIHVLVPVVDPNFAIACVGALMIVYVLTGGMLATTWVQIIKAVLLLAAALIMTVLVLLHYNFSLSSFFNAAANVHVAGTRGSVNLLQPGLLYQGKLGAINLISLALALVLGTAGLPHILMRFYTVPNARAARRSVAWAMVLIGVFYITTMFMGLGAATLVGRADIGPHLRDVGAIRYIAHHPAQQATLNAKLARDGYVVPEQNSNLTTPLLANALGGSYLMAFVAAVAFATILAVVAGLTIAASSAFAHDIWWNLVRHGKGNEAEQLRVARATAIAVGLISIVLSLGLRWLNVAFLVGLAFAVAASANVPAIVLSLMWKRFNRTGALVGMITGLLTSLVLIAISPAAMGIDPVGAPMHHIIQAAPLFPLDNPGIVSIPLGFIGAILGALLSRDDQAERDYNQLVVRANTGMGAEI
jgi:cation/acetate symporter